MQSWKRIISLLLALSMMASYFPTPVYAEEIVEEIVEEVVEEVIEEVPEEVTEEVIEEVIGEITEEVAEEVVEEVTEELVEEITAAATDNVAAADEDETPLVPAETIVANGQCGAQGDNVKWKLDDRGTLTVYGTGAMKDYSTSGSPWYSRLSQIKTVIIGDGVTKVGNHAFFNCTTLTSVTFGIGVTSIGAEAFDSCTGLTGTLTIPGNVKTIDSYAFDNCKNLTGLLLEQGVKSIGYCAFRDCAGLTGELVIPDSVTSLGDWVFQRCMGLTGLKLSSALTKLGDGVFHECSGLTGELVIPDSVTSIGGVAFAGTGFDRIEFLGTAAPSVQSDSFSSMKALTAVSVPAGSLDAYTSALSGKVSVPVEEKREFLGSGQTGTAQWALSSDGVLTVSGGEMADFASSSDQPWYDLRSQITQIVIADDVTRVGAYAFRGCSAATKLTIGTGVTEIGNYAFYGCSYLETIEFNAANMADPIADNYIFGYVATKNDGAVVRIGPAVTKIPAYLFYQGTDYYPLPVIVGLEFAEGSVCESIGNQAFYNAKIQSLALPDSMRTIGNYAFQSTPLTELDLGSGLTDIGYGAFKWCYIPEVVIPDNVKTIGTLAFYGNGALTTLTIGKGVTSIGGSAFYECKKLTRINYNAVNASLPDRANAVFDYAGMSTDGITVHIGAEVKAIPAMLFEGFYSDRAPKIVKVTFEEGSVCTKISKLAFGYCRYLEYLELPESITTIENMAFVGCTNLKQIDFNAACLYSVGDSAFSSAGTGSGGITLNIGPKAERIPAYLCDCSSIPRIQQVNFAEDGICSIIGTEAFKNNPYLTEILLPETITHIGTEAFSGCNNLIIFLSGEMPQTLGTNWRAGAAVCTVPETYSNEGFFSYWVEDNGAVLGKYRGSDSLLTLPETLGGYAVTAVESYAFSMSTAQKSVKLPASVNYVGEYALSASGVNHLRFIGSAPVFAENAFSGKTVTVHYPANDPTWTAEVLQDYGGTVTWIPLGENAVDGGVCGSKLNWVLTEDGTLTISGSGSMYDYDDGTQPWYKYREQITALVLDEQITKLGRNAFRHLTGLTGTLCIAPAVTQIGERAFAFSGFEKVEFTNTTPPTVGSDIFGEMENLTEIWVPLGTLEAYTETLTGNIPEGVSILEKIELMQDGQTGTASWVLTSDGVLTVSGGEMADYSTASEQPWYALKGQIKKIVIEDDVTKIGAYSFYGNSSATEITIGKAVASIGQYAFYNCDFLTKVDFRAVNMADLGNSNRVFSYAGCNGSGITVTVGNQVERIPGYLFCPYDTSGSDNPKVTAVQFEEGSVCTTIDIYAFRYCSIERIDLPESLEQIKYCAFANNTKLTEILIPDKVIHIGENTFRSCTALKTLTLGQGVTEIGNYAFYSCNALAEINIPDSVKTIGTYAFAECSAATKLTIGQGVTSMGNGAFQNCKSVSEVYYNAVSAADLGGSNDVLKNIGVNVSGVTLTVGNKVRRIPNRFFCPVNNRDNARLTRVEFEEGSVCTEIGSYAFSYQGALQEIELPESLTSIGDRAFHDCQNLKKVSFNAVSMKNLKSSSEVFYTAGTGGSGFTVTVGPKVERIPAYLFQNLNSGKVKLIGVEFEDNSSCKEIGISAFYNNDLLHSITLPQSVTSIGEQAFGYCEKLTVLCSGDPSAIQGSWKYGVTLCDVPETYAEEGSFSYWVEDGGAVIAKYLGSGTSITVPQTIGGQTVKALADYAFFSLNKVTALTLPEGLETIGTNALYGCSITELVLPSTVSRLSASAFGSYGTLYLRFTGDAPAFDAKTFSGKTATANYPAGNATWTSEKLQNYGGTVTWAAYVPGAVANGSCGTNLEWVLYENGTLRITGSGAMNNFSSGKAPWYTFREQIKTLVLDEQITSIGDYAFYNCAKITGELKLPAGLTYIGQYAFYGCTGLTGKLVIPDSVTNIGGRAFYGCSGLTGVLVIPDSIKYIYSETFYNCKGLTGLELPDALIEIYGHAFYGCTGLTGELVIPDKVTDIRYNAFTNCTGLSSITFGKSVKYIGYTNVSYDTYSFYNCIGVTEITFTGDTPPSFDSTKSFASLTNLKTVYVPAASLKAYRTSLSGKLPDGAVIKADTTSPIAGLSAAQVYSRSALLTWEPYPAEGVETYVISRDGTEIGRTTDCRFADTGLELERSYLYTVQACINGELTQKADITVTTVRPVVEKVESYRNFKLNTEKNTITVTVRDSGNLLPLDGRETVLNVFYVQDKQTFPIGTGIREGNVYTVTWDISGLPDGEYLVHAELTDVDGDTGGYAQVLTIDNSQPSAVTGLLAMGSVEKIHLNWNLAQEYSTAGYNIYRRHETEDDFRPVHSVQGRENLTWTDTDVLPEGMYYYRIKAFNELEAEGDWSNIAAATLVADTSEPKVDSFLPANGSCLTGTKVIIVNASDNVCVIGITLEYSTDEKNWTLLTRLDAGENRYTLDSRTLPDGPLFFRATAEDAAGNKNSMTYQYTVDNTGPDRVTGITWEATSVTATIRWKNVTAEDVSYFRVERLTSDGNWVKVKDVSDTLGINLYNLTPGTEYTYRVTAFDLRDNGGIPSEAVTITTLADTTAPVVTKLRPLSGYYSKTIPLTVTAEDEHCISSVTVQTSPDQRSWKNVTTRTYTGIHKSVSFRYDLDLADYAEGDLYVRAVAVDLAGNQSNTGLNAPCVQHIVDKTPPAAPQNVKATGYGGYIQITWDQGTEKDLNLYSLYRAEGETGDFKLLAENLAKLGYNDQTTKADTDYRYKVCVSDKAGNISAFSATVTARMKPDTTNPVIKSIYPASGSYVGSDNLQISISAQDDSGIALVSFAYSTNGEDYTIWYTLDVEKDGNDAVKLPLSNFSHGDTLYIRVQAQDKAGNLSEYKTATYHVDTKAPDAYDVTAEFDAEGSRVILRWTGKDKEDLYRYRVYRTVDGKESLIGYCSANNCVSAGEGTWLYTFYDQGISQEAVTYLYRIETVDQCGNTVSAKPVTVTLPDRSVPKVILGCDSFLNVNTEYRFDGSGSSDNSAIDTYHWDFGDGTTSDKAVVLHKYTQVGTYTVRLTVTDDTGLSSFEEKTVTVSEPTATGTALIQILDEAGQGVSGAPVYFDLGETNQAIKYTDSQGTVVFTAAPGVHTVGCIIANNQWLPVKKDMEIFAGQESGMAMTLVKQAMVTGEFETNRMTFDEIKAAGIDVSKPENVHLMKAQVTLSYGTAQSIQTSFIFDLNGRIVPDNDGNDGSFLIPGGTSGEPPRKLTPTVLNPGNTKAMTIAFLDMPVEASFLKEFFDVKLHILNNASSDFPLVDNLVTLHVPDGLTLVDRNDTESSATVTVPVIGGGTTHTVNWILRGDKSGSYHLSADYSGTLPDFDEQINATFRTAEPIRVYGTEAVKLVARIAPNINYGAFYFDLSLVNDSDIDVYLPGVDVSGGILDSYLIRINEEADKLEDTQLTHKAPLVRQLSTVLENSLGARKSLSPDTVLQTLAAGESLTKRYAVYNVVAYNNRLLLIGAMEKAAAELGFRFQVIVSDMDLYDSDNALGKLEALSGDNQAMYNYLMDGSNFFYVRQAVDKDEEALTALSGFDYAPAREAMALSTYDEDALRAVTRKLVAQLMVDEALAEAINGHVTQLYDNLVKDICKDIHDYLGKVNGSHIQTFFQAHMGKQDTLKTLAQTLKDQGSEAMMELLIEQLTELGMTDEEGSILMEYTVSGALDEAQIAALKNLCGNHRALLEDLTGSFEGWQRYAELLQTVLTICAAYDKTIELMDLLGQDPQLDPIAADEIAKLRLQLESLYENRLLDYQAKSQKSRGNGNNGNNRKGKDKETKEDLEDSFGPANNVPDTFSRLLFGTMMDQISYWNADDDAALVLKVHNELSMVMTKLVNTQMESQEEMTEQRALETLTALKYLIRLRLMGEQTFVFFGNASDNSDDHLALVDWINLVLDSRFASLDQYADYVLTLLLEYRDSIYIRSSETLDVPEAPTVTIDYRKERTAESFSSDYEYSFTGDLWITGSGSPISLNPGTVGKYLWIRAKATDGAFAGNVTKLYIPARPRIGGDITVIYDKTDYILTGLTPGSYHWAVTENTQQTQLDGTLDVPQNSTGVKVTGLHKDDIWMALRAEATDSAFASVIRYVATRISEYKWHINYDKGLLENLLPGTLWEDVDQANKEHGKGNGQHKPNKNNKSNGKMATGDTVTLNTDQGTVSLQVVVKGDVDGNAQIDVQDVNAMIGHVSQGTAAALTDEYREAACTWSGRQENEDISIFDIYAVLDSNAYGK